MVEELPSEQWVGRTAPDDPMNLTVNLYGERPCDNTHEVERRPGRNTGRTHCVSRRAFAPELPIWVGTERGACANVLYMLRQGWVRPRGNVRSSRAALRMRYSTTGQQTDHPLRAIRVLADEALRSMSMRLARLNSDRGLPVAPARAVAARIAVPGALQGPQRTAPDGGAGLQPAVPVFRRVEQDDPVCDPSTFAKESGPVAGRRDCANLLRRNQLSGSCGGSALRRAFHRRRARFWEPVTVSAIMRTRRRTTDINAACDSLDRVPRGGEPLR